MIIFQKIWDFIKSLFSRKDIQKDMYIPINNINDWSDLENQLFILINSYRESLNLPLLFPEKYIREQAEVRVDYCIGIGKITHNYLGVVNNNIKYLGFKWVYENLAYGYSNPENVFKAFQKSKSHNKNIINPEHKYIGINIKFFEEKMYVCVLLVK